MARATRPGSMASGPPAGSTIPAPGAGARALGDPSPLVRQVAAHAAGLWRDKEAVPGLVEMLRNGQEPAARALAEALGRIGEASAVPALLEAAGRATGRIMEHSVTYALIELGDAQATRRGLKASTAGSRRAAMIALDQMDGGGLDAPYVAGLLTSGDRELAEAASWIVGRHPEWAGELAGVLGARLARADLAAAERAELERHLGRFAEAAPIQHLLAARLRDDSVSRAERLSCLAAMSRSGVKAGKVPREWIDALATAPVVGDRGGPIDGTLVAAIVTTARALPIAREADRAGALALGCSGSPRTPPTRPGSGSTPWPPSPAGSRNPIDPYLIS